MLFIIYQLEDYWNIMKLRCRPLTLNSYKAFSKNKNRSGKTLSASFFRKFLKKKIMLYFVTWGQVPYLTIWLLLINEILGNIQCRKGKPLESLAISVIPGFQSLSMHHSVTWSFFFLGLFSFCINFLHHWWLLKVKK